MKMAYPAAQFGKGLYKLLDSSHKIIVYTVKCLARRLLLFWGSFNFFPWREMDLVLSEASTYLRAFIGVTLASSSEITRQLRLFSL